MINLVVGFYSPAPVFLTMQECILIIHPGVWAEDYLLLILEPCVHLWGPQFFWFGPCQESSLKAPKGSISMREDHNYGRFPLMSWRTIRLGNLTLMNTGTACDLIEKASSFRQSSLYVTRSIMKSPTISVSYPFSLPSLGSLPWKNSRTIGKKKTKKALKSTHCHKWFKKQ